MWRFFYVNLQIEDIYGLKGYQFVMFNYLIRVIRFEALLQIQIGFNMVRGREKDVCNCSYSKKRFAWLGDE